MRLWWVGGWFVGWWVWVGVGAWLGGCPVCVYVGIQQWAGCWMQRVPAAASPRSLTVWHASACPLPASSVLQCAPIAQLYIDGLF